MQCVRDRSVHPADRRKATPPREAVAPLSFRRRIWQASVPAAIGTLCLVLAVSGQSAMYYALGATNVIGAFIAYFADGEEADSTGVLILGTVAVAALAVTVIVA